MDLDEITHANKIAWNEAAPHHRKHTFDNLLNQFSLPEFSCLGPLKTRLLHAINIRGKKVAQAACNNGRELISIKRLGAGSCVGFDISEEFIKQGRLLAGAAQVEIHFVVSDVYKLPEEYDEQFDVVFISSGTLRWMPDLNKFFASLSRLLQAGGKLLILEMHPILNTISAEGVKNRNLTFDSSYFTSAPFKTTAGLDYYSQTRYDASPAFWCHHKLSDVVNACSMNGLSYERMEEFPFDLSGGSFKFLEKRHGIFPLSFALVVNKPVTGKIR